VSTEVDVDLRSAADREDEIVAVVGRVGKLPVAGVVGVPRSLEGEGQHARVVRQSRVHDVLSLIGDRLSVPTCRPTISRDSLELHPSFDFVYVFVFNAVFLL